MLLFWELFQILRFVMYRFLCLLFMPLLAFSQNPTLVVSQPIKSGILNQITPMLARFILASALHLPLKFLE